jgi:protein ImuA
MAGLAAEVMIENKLRTFYNVRMSTHLLSRHSHRPRARLSLFPTPQGAAPIDLALGRAHEACGPARHSFALWLAAASSGAVLWISPQWEPARLNPDGMREFTDPGRFLFTTIPRREDLLWAVEEALRSGAAPLVVAELDSPPAMTPVRRLHLAAEQGGAHGAAPLALLLTPGQGGAAGIESRWHVAPAHHAEQRIWQLKRLRARTQPPAQWQVQQQAPGAPLQPSPLPSPPTRPSASSATSARPDGPPQGGGSQTQL